MELKDEILYIDNKLGVEEILNLFKSIMKQGISFKEIQLKEGQTFCSSKLFQIISSEMKQEQITFFSKELGDIIILKENKDG
jgi:hypothetical protein